MIPILYGTGKIVADRKAGIIAACLISVIAGEYLYRSFFGYLDHHIMEVLFSTAFMLCYLIILRKIQVTDDETTRIQPGAILWSAAAGILFYLGMMNMPTMVLFAGIIGIFCFLHAITTRSTHILKSLARSHLIIFGLFAVLYALTGIHATGMSLSQYTPVHLVIALLLIAEPIILTAIIHLSAHRPIWMKNIAIIAIPVATLLLLTIIAPSISGRFIDGLQYFFLFSYQDTFINEMQMWELDRALHSFNLALLIMVIGLAITGVQVWRRDEPVKTCALIWALVILVSTILHLRYEYYAAVIVVLFSSVFLAWFYERIRDYFSKPDQNIRKKERDQPDRTLSSRYLPVVVIGLIILVITMFSAQITWNVATTQLQMIGMNDDWAESLEWLSTNTPDTGIDPLTMYEKEGFSYPDTAYGILSWWDYGHWISYLGQRIPITTPFQNNVQPVARFLVETDEEKADLLAGELGARYVIVDYEMITSKYPSLPLWANGRDARDQFQKYYYQQDSVTGGQYNPILTLRPDFFTSMVSRLYIFDGSLTRSAGGSRIRYEILPAGNQQIPIISRIEKITSDEAEKLSTSTLEPGTDLVSIQFTRPVPAVPALTHYRLVHESPAVTAADELAQLHNVKIFERVPGYRVKGTGIIELPLITNQGRTFTYRQESMNGTFTLPYTTARDGDGVRAAGPYRIAGTGQTLEVSEEQVQNGR